MISKRLKIFFYYFENDTMSTDAVLALEKLGINVLKYRAATNSDRTVLFDPIELLNKVISFSPDYFIFLNNFGIDINCDILKALSILGVKSISWFIDNPFYFYDHLNSMKNLNNFYAFVWEKFYINHLLNFGLKNVFYLPQATNPERFYHIELSSVDKDYFSHNLTFAGNLDFMPFQKLNNDFISNYPEYKESFNEMLEKLSVLALTNQNIPSWEIVQSFVNHHKYSALQNDKAVYSIARLLEAKVSMLIRKEFVEILSGFNLGIWGNDFEWKDFNDKVKILGKASYFNQMPKVYNGSKINLNISRIQQRTGTNQRVFDVPACKSFLISDYKEELEEMFDLGKEMIVYKNFDELKNLIHFYSDDTKRKEIAYKGYLKVLEKHTYSHRMTELFQTIQDYKLQTEDMFKPENDTPLFWIAKAFIKANRKREAIDCLKILIKISKKYYNETYDILMNLC